MFAPAIDGGPNVGLRVATAACVGGITSSLAGGSFENGAITGAFSRLFNDEMHLGEKGKELLDGPALKPDEMYPPGSFNYGMGELGVELDKSLANGFSVDGKSIKLFPQQRLLLANLPDFVGAAIVFGSGYALSTMSIPLNISVSHTFKFGTNTSMKFQINIDAGKFGPGFDTRTIRQPTITNGTVNFEKSF